MPLSLFTFVDNRLPWKGSTKTFLSRARETLPGRWFWLLIGLGLLVNGQYLIFQRETIGETKPALDLWNITFRLDIVNIQNFGKGFPYLLAGGLLCAMALVSSWKRQEVPSSNASALSKINWAYLAPRLEVGILLFAYLIFKLSRHEYEPLFPWLWLFVLVLFTLSLHHHEKTSGVDLSLHLARLDATWIAVLFLLGLGVGSFALRDIPPIMVPDEGSFWEIARAIARGELKPPFFDFGVYTFPVASSIFQGWIMRLFGVNIWGWRFSSVLAGTAAAPPLYLLAREWFDRRVAVMATLFTLTSSYYLSFARLGYNNSQALFPVVASLYFWSLGYKRSSSLFYWLAGLTAGLGFYTYPAAWLGLIAILLTLALLAVIRRIKFRQALLAAGIFLGAVIVTAGPRFVYGASSQNTEPLFYKMLETSFISNFYGSAFYGSAELYPHGVAYMIGENQIFYAPEVYAELLVRGVVRTVAALFDPFIVTEHFITTNLAGGFLPALGLALGLGFSLRTIKQTRSILLLTWLSAGLVTLSIIAAFPPRHTHLVTVIPTLALLAAIGFAATVDTLAGEIQKRWAHFPSDWAARTSLVLLSLIVVLFGLREYFTVMPTRNPPLFEDIASWIAWRTDEPLTLVYVGNTGTHHRVEYLVNTHMVPHKYISVAPENFKWQDVPSKSIVFIEMQPEGKWTPLPEPPPRFTNHATYTNHNGDLLGYAWANTNVELQPKLSLPDFTGLPLTAALGVAIIAALAFLLRGTIRLEKTDNGLGFRFIIEVQLRKKT